jgi:hypothetical protein
MITPTTNAIVMNLISDWFSERIHMKPRAMTMPLRSGRRRSQFVDSSPFFGLTYRNRATSMELLRSSRAVWISKPHACREICQRVIRIGAVVADENMAPIFDSGPEMPTLEGANPARGEFASRVFSALSGEANESVGGLRRGCSIPNRLFSSSGHHFQNGRRWKIDFG